MSATSTPACASASAIRAPRTWSAATCCTTSPRPIRTGWTPLLDAIADAAGRLAAGDEARFLTDVARRLQSASGAKTGKADRKSGDTTGEDAASADKPAVAAGAAPADCERTAKPAAPQPAHPRRRAAVQARQRAGREPEEMAARARAEEIADLQEIRSMGFKCGIVGLPNVGKSTLFNALTQTAAAEAANYPFCTIEPNVGDVGVPDPRLDKLREIAGSAAGRPDPAHLRRHRRPRARRLQGRGPRQPVPGPHPRGGCGGLRAALLRGPRRDARRGPHRSHQRRRHGRDRADDRRHGEPGAAPRAARQEGHLRRQGGQGAGGADRQGAGAGQRRQARAPGQAHARRRSGPTASCSC